MGKKTGKKRYDKFFIEVFFKKPWCPLFGHIFWNDEPLPPSSQIERCFSIIQDARRLWKTEDTKGFDCSHQGWYGEHSWPEPEEIPDYPKDLILAAREISRCWMSIYQYSVLHSHQPDAYYKKENGDSEPRHTLDTVWDKAIDVAKSICHSNYFDKDGTLKPINKFEDIPGFAILAILAIKEAHWALRLIVEVGESEDNPEVIKLVQVAGSLLARAKEENLRPDAERNARQRKYAAQQSVKKRKRNAEDNKTLWLKTAKDLKKQFPGISSTSNITQKVCDKLNIPQKSRQSVYKFLLKNSV